VPIATSPSPLQPVPDVVFIASAPVHPAYPGGFASRHHKLVTAVAKVAAAELFYLCTPESQELMASYPPPERCTVTFMQSRRSRREFRIPSQSLARSLRMKVEALVVPLTPNTAHVALGCRRAVVIVEEGWDRALQGGVRAAVEGARYRSLYRRLGAARFPLVAITELEAAHLRRYAPEAPITTVRYEVDVNYFQPRQGNQDIDVLIAGAVNRREQLIEEFVTALRRHPATAGVKCVVVGGAPRQSIVALSDCHTEITGYVSDIRPFYGRARVVAIPTFLGVGIKTTMLQAWAMARPVVSSPEVLAAAPEGAAATFVGSDPEQLVVQVARLLNDEPLRRAAGDAGRSTVGRYYSQTEHELSDLVLAELPPGTRR
jgi:glycosyltransferase involved in cell wall biosynthesis